MKLFNKKTEHDIILIAEIGVNHEGNFSVAKEMIYNLSKCNIDAIKLQSYTPEKFVSSINKERLDRVRKFSLTKKEHISLSEYTKSLGIGFFSTPLSEDWVSVISEIGDAIKIASGDIDFFPVIEESAKTNLPIILSTGCSEINEIDKAVSAISKYRNNISENVALMHCISKYPASLEECNLKSIDFLRDRYKLTVGWSNHVIGPLACYAAVARGASIIEVHVTDNRDNRDFRDHDLSFEYNELSILSENLSSLKRSLGNYEKKPTLDELKIKNELRKGVVAARDIDLNTIISRKDLAFARPAHGFKLYEINDLVGKKMKQKIVKDEIFLDRHFN